MKFREILSFELAYQLRRPWPWLFFAVLLVVNFLMTRDNTLSEALYADFFVNSPFAIAKTMVFGGLMWLLMAAAIAGEAAARDVATGMHPLMYTMPLSKAGFLGGRFLAALLLNALILLAVPAGILLAVYAPGVDPVLIGPFRPAAYLTNYAFLLLPNALVATAIQFSLAALSGRAMAGYIGSMLLVFMGFFVASLLLYKRGLGKLLDPIGIRFIVEDMSREWTTIEKSWRLVTLEGTVLSNRLLWLGIALVALTVTYMRFRIAHRVSSAWWKRRTKRQDAYPSADATAGLPVHIPQVPQTFGFVLHFRQMLAIAWTSFHTTAKSWVGLALLTAIPLLTVLIVIDQMFSNGVPLVPTTMHVIRELTAPLSAELSRWVIIPGFIIFFAGELVWREREAGLGEITAAMPGSEWAPLLGKFLGLGWVLALFMALQIMAGMLAQTVLDYQHFEIGLYLKIMFGLQLPEYLLFALLALVVHVVVNQKYAGHLVAIITYVFMALASLFGVEHNLLVYGAGPGWSYTEMRGFDASLGPWLWFKLYWAAWALLLAVVARLFWVRGREEGIGVRLRLARRRFTRATAWTSVIGAGLMLLLGGFIFYNTNVLNEYLSTSGIKERRAEYERRYGRYNGIAQPRLAGAKLQVEIYPVRREVEISGSYRLFNNTAETIDSIHVANLPGVEPGKMVFNRTASLLVADKERGYRIYVLKMPLQPGDSLQLHFEAHIGPHGFREDGLDASVAANGTYFMAGDWLPGIGYQPGRELLAAADRRAYGLAPRPIIPSLYNVEARKNRGGGGIAFEAVVGTAGDQVAVAPGALRRTWERGKRRYFYYATDSPIGNEWAIFSARYAVRETRWNDVAIRIFHDPRHTRNLDRMVRSIRASLDYYTQQFGAYRHRHISVVERPGDGTGMHADASMLTYTEGVSLWNPKDEPGSLDLPYAVAAHEMAHQWTVPYANVEGAPVMSESVAWYYAMKAVENARGPGQLRQLLSFMRQPYPYPPIRRGEPLLRGLDPYLSYRKGPFALYALSESVGQERVNAALRRLLEKHRPEQAPLATTLDLYSELKAVTPDSLRYLLHDLFEVNTNWDLKTEGATALPTPDGRWQVTLKIRVRKMVFDSAGVETPVPLNDWVQIGVFASGGGESTAPLYLQKHHLRSGSQIITVTVPRRPVQAGIDPNYLLIDGKTDDNMVEVKEKK